MLRKPRNLVWIATALGLLFAAMAGISGHVVLYNILIFCASLLLLLKSASLLVDGSSNIARYFGISSVVIGMTVVAFGTSLPELTVSAMANLAGSAGISIGNIIGSNISNICLVLGIAALIVPIKIKREVLRFDFPFLIGVSLLLLILTMGTLPGTGYTIGLVDGIIMLALFSLFMYVQVVSVHHHKRKSHPSRERKRLLNHIVLTLGGLTGVIVSAGLLVDSSISIARLFGIPEIIIGLTVIAVGTSLPELATNVMAALKREFGIAIGNIIGSNVFNILLVLGTASVIKPIQDIDKVAVMTDMPIMIGLTVFLFILIRRGSELSRRDGALLLSLYVIYILARVLF